MRGITMLADDFDINVKFGHVGAAVGAETDPITRTITIDHRLGIDDLGFIIRDLWSRLTIGAHASVAIETPGPTLRLVPPARALDEVSA